MHRATKTGPARTAAMMVGSSLCRRLLLIVMVMIVAGGGYLGYLRFSGNFHEVVAGELYRSGQMSPALLSRYVRQYGIRTIVNLRPDRNGAWYRDEVATAATLNVRHIDFGMTDYKIVAPERAEDLVEILRDARKPILIHCKAGADRSGLAAVLYLNKIKGDSVADSGRQLSLYYGHIAIPYLSRSFAMDTSWQQLQTDFDDAAIETAEAEANLPHIE